MSGCWPGGVCAASWMTGACRRGCASTPLVSAPARSLTARGRRPGRRPVVLLLAVSRSALSPALRRQPNGSSTTWAWTAARVVTEPGTPWRPSLCGRCCGGRGQGSPARSGRARRAVTRTARARARVQMQAGGAGEDAQLADTCCWPGEETVAVSSRKWWRAAGPAGVWPGRSRVCAWKGSCRE